MNANDPLGARLRPALLALAASALFCLMQPAYSGALPDGGHFVAGSGSIAQSGTSLTINQSTARGVIDWNGFSIDRGNQVSFNNGNGATLNRITGGNASTILGSLSATGSLYVINPQGIVIGSSGIVSTGGRFVASTLDTDNTSFMNGGPLTLSGSSPHRVVNLGHIGSTNGDVFLVSADEIDNFGLIGAPKGTAEFAVGKKVLLQDSSTSKQVFVQTGSRGTIWNQGDIAAAQINLQAADGNIFALAGHNAAPRATGTATRDGHVWLVAEEGTVNMSGLFGAMNADGSGGTVDTVAHRMAFPDIGPGIIGRVWNITTPQFKLGAPSGRAFAQTLNGGTSINVQTTGGIGSIGNIEVASNLGWTGSGTLTLGAYQNVVVDKGVTIQNKWASGNLALRADVTGIDNGGSVINNGTIDWSKSNGAVSALYDMNGSYTPGTLMANPTWAAPADSGLVTQFTGYRLANSMADLRNITDPTGNYALGRDVDGDYTYLNPIGGGEQPFTGQFDGLGHTIDEAWLGGGTALFNRIGKGGVVRNLGLTNADSGYSGCSVCYAYGILANENDGLVLRTYTTGDIYYVPRNGPPGPGDTNFGGLVGVNRGIIAQSWSGASVSGAGDIEGVPATGNLGGLVSYNAGTITQSYATGWVSGGSGANLAGLVAINDGAVTQSFATGFTRGGANGGSGLIGGGSGGSLGVYWNVDTTGVADGGGDVPSQNGLTSAQMTNPANFVNWNFGRDGVWAMPAGADHPVLRWEIQSSAIPFQ